MIAIISGGSGAVGKAIGKKLSAEGFDIVALYNKAPREEVNAALATFAPGNHEAIACDITNASAVEKMFAYIKERGESIGVVVHAAVDPILRKPILEMTVGELEEQFKTGVLGGFNLLAHAGRIMKVQKSGAIVGILSQAVVSERPHPRMAGYAVAKSALRGLLRELHDELAASNVTVNAVAPDFMDTKLNSDLPTEVRKFVAERGVTSSIKSPEDVARAVAHLASKKGATVNGEIFSFEEKERFRL